jgi:hypothetical protein
VQLKAIQVMEGAEGKGPAVTVNVSQTSNTLVAGYVIRRHRQVKGALS